MFDEDYFKTAVPVGVQALASVWCAGMRRWRKGGVMRPPRAIFVFGYTQEDGVCRVISSRRQTDLERAHRFSPQEPRVINARFTNNTEIDRGCRIRSGLTTGPRGPSRVDGATAPNGGRAAGRDFSENYPDQGQQQARPCRAGAHAYNVARSPLRPSRAARTQPMSQRQPRR